ncbi:MAG TPA: restriction endonuclease subunit S [Verrucomicrobiae bacterium]|nr:restriction endonuclease subunit S [Verrucomicrobiae bacterium]
MSEWRKVRFGELGEVNRGRSRNRPRYAEHLYGGPYPFIQTGDIKASNGRITSHQQTYSEAGLAQSRLWPAGTLCITIAADIAETGILSYPACFPDSVVGFVADQSKCEVLFIEYMFRHLRRHIQHEATGSVQDNINLETLNRLEIPLPPLPEQRAIAAVLGALDDKIELNRRMNETLEALAQSLFKSWFVPACRSLGAGRDATQSALSKGWRAGTLGEVEENPRRGIQPDEIKTDTAYIGLEHMPRRSIALSDWGHTEKLESGKFEFERGEILFGKLRPYFHKVGVAPLDGVCSTDILVVTPKEPAWFGFVLAHVSSVELVNHTNAASTGTKMPRANWNDISRYEVALPPKQLAADFTEKIHPLVERIIANIHESRTLAALRDALLPKLLPKLLSGELRVPAAAGSMEARA